MPHACTDIPATALPARYPTLSSLQAALDAGHTSACDLTEQALARIADPAGEGARTFTQIYAAQARNAAQASDTLRRAGLKRSAIEGLPISVKDLFDVAAQVTTAGSTVLRNAAPATRHATIVQRLLCAGAIIVGRTNMTEFAYSGLGLNPHYGTPRNPWDRGCDGGTGRIPGGSSSGAAVSVTDGMCAAAIGTDTGGSVRIPAALCALTGFKPTARRVPLTGSIALSPTLDSIGPLAASVQCCATLDAVMTGHDPGAGDELCASAPAPNLLRLAVPQLPSVVFEGMDACVANAWEAALGALARAGARIIPIPLPEFDALSHLHRNGFIPAAEAWQAHAPRLQGEEGAAYDPRVASRIRLGAQMSAEHYLTLLQERRVWQQAVHARLHAFDALMLPTVPTVAPRIAALRDDDAAYFSANALILRNPTFINFLDGCALSLPCHHPGEAPVGLMLAAPAGHDAALLRIAHTVQAVLDGR